MNKKLLLPLGLILSFFLPSPEVMAEEKTAPSYTLSIGYGLGIKKNLRQGNTYEDTDKDVLVKNIPLVQGSVGRFSLGPQGLSFMALGNRFMNMSVFINQGGDRYHGQGMIPRKGSFFAGISGKLMKYSLSVSKDINGHSKAYLIHANYSEVYLLTEQLMLRVGGGIEWYDDHYAEYYYGVRAHEATATRSEYHLTNYFQPGVGVFPIYKISEKLSFMVGINTKYVPKKIRKSPTMNGNSLEFGGLVGISYAL
jgi:MipA family protein